MGTYVLNLTTRSRKVPGPDGTIEVFTFKYSHKDSFHGVPKWARAVQGKIENAWCRRDPATYVCYSTEFHPDTAVYAAHGPKPIPLVMTDGAFDHLKLVGFLRGPRGRAQRFEPWFCLPLEGDLVNSNGLDNLMRGPWRLVRTFTGLSEPSGYFYARDMADIATAKLALV